MTAGWSVVYSGDTRPCDNVVMLAKASMEFCLNYILQSSVCFICACCCQCARNCVRMLMRFGVGATGGTVFDVMMDGGACVMIMRLTLICLC